MDIKAKVISVEMNVEIAKKDGGVYPGARLMYRDEAGQLKEQAFHNNTFKFNAPLKVQLSNLAAGDDVIITKEKKGDFWNVMSISKDTGGGTGSSNATTTIMQPASKVPASPSPRSNYETPEERAQRQVYIIRQSSISSAVALVSQDGNFFKGTENPVGEVLSIAEAFENYVMGNPFPIEEKDFTGLEDDTDGIV